MTSEAEKIIFHALRDAGASFESATVVPAVAAALRDAGMLVKGDAKLPQNYETGWEYTGETDDTRGFTDDPEVVKRWAKRGVYNIRRRTKAVHPGPWSPIPEGEPE